MRSGARIVTGQRLDRQQGPADRDADLIVGADGIWSATRRELDPAAPQPVYAKIYYISGTSDGSRIQAEISRQGFNWIFAKHGVFIYLPAPDGIDLVDRAGRCPPAAARPSRGEPDATWRNYSAPSRRRRPCCGRPPALRAANIGHVLAPVRRRYQGTTVLVGDAAHPVGAGQGASMAMEDAVVLARQLAAADSITAGLAAFDQRGIPARASWPRPRPPTGTPRPQAPSQPGCAR